MIFTTSSSESIVVFFIMKAINWTLLHYQRNYSTTYTFSKLPEKKNKIFRTFYSRESKRAHEQICRTIVLQYNFNETAGTDECSVQVKASY